MSRDIQPSPNVKRQKSNNCKDPIIEKKQHLTTSIDEASSSENESQSSVDEDLDDHFFRHRSKAPMKATIKPRSSTDEIIMQLEERISKMEAKLDSALNNNVLNPEVSQI